IFFFSNILSLLLFSLFPYTTLFRSFTISLLSLTLYLRFFNRAISLLLVNVLVLLDFVIMQSGKWNWLILDSKKLFSISWSWMIYKLIFIVFVYLIVEWTIMKKEIM